MKSGYPTISFRSDFIWRQFRSRAGTCPRFEPLQIAQMRGQNSALKPGKNAGEQRATGMYRGQEPAALERRHQGHRERWMAEERIFSIEREATE